MNVLNERLSYYFIYRNGDNTLRINPFDNEEVNAG